MAGLSSNWKKLQAKLKEESASKPSLKRKSADSSTPTSKKSKVSNKAAPTLSKSRPRLASRPQMGAVHSTAVEDAPGSATSTSLALWKEDSGVTAEALAEAYNLGTKDNSMILAAARDKINSGLIEGIEIGKYVAIDCEMVGVGPGGYESVLARVSVVDFHGRQVYDSYVKPKEKVTNWRTEVSGISQKNMRFARDFEEAQNDIDKLLQGRILVGHDIKHDLEALKLSHPARDIRDTAKYSAFRKHGNGRKPALRLLAQQLLGVEIQDGAHSSIEDARVTMLLFRKHKQGFDVDHSNRYSPKTLPGSGTQKGNKSKKKRK
ncbi:ribonuclease H-like domain-containing protein [Mariannaea sp. PMI_226]|nr:ribonuclease H-like domain-containing protein [Mariannaea sp. PMI_226]